LVVGKTLMMEKKSLPLFYCSVKEGGWKGNTLFAYLIHWGGGFESRMSPLETPKGVNPTRLLAIDYLHICVIISSNNMKIN